MKQNRHNKNWLVGLLLATIAGCGQADPPQFRLNMVSAVSNEVGPEYQQEVADVLTAMFGTPDDPHVLPEMGLDVSKLRMAAGPAWSDQAGTNFGLYRKHCVHCHGVTGDGRGPTARFLNPYPRDYRLGVYKFKSTYNPAKPTDVDLHRILVNGVPGTAMPSFSLLPNSEVEALVEYVKYLSLRGQMESALYFHVNEEYGQVEATDAEGNPMVDKDGNPVMTLLPFDPASDPELRDAIMDMLADVLEGWQSANEQMMIPTEATLPGDDRSSEEVLASITAGRELFYGTKANCIQCHGPTALGDGQQTDFDAWQKAHQQFLETTAQEVERLADLANEDDPDPERLREGYSWLARRQEVADSLYPIRNAIPRNLRQGVYRGGQRRLDIFWRIYAGIPGTPMPAVGPASPGAQGTLTEEQIWNLVDYVLSLPYEVPSQPQTALPKNVDEVL